MRKIYILLSLLCLVSITKVIAQHKEYRGKMSVIPLRLEQKGDSLYIHIDFNIQGINVDSRRSISLIPILVTPSTELRLPEVMVKGRGNYLIWGREFALMSKAERSLYEQQGPYAILKGYSDKGQKHLSYNLVVPFEPWMKEARLDIREDLCGCGNRPRSLEISQLVNRVQLERIIEPYIVTPYPAYVQPVPERIKKREIMSEAFLDFIVSKIDIRPDYLNNPRELKKITDMVEEVKSDPSVTVKGISVVGYASPEGTLEFNSYLSQGRAKALVDYLVPRFDYPRNTYHVRFGGENWQGLLEVIERSEMKDKKEVWSILTNQTFSDETRKKQLKQLKNGEPYLYMLKEYYPYLRKASCKIDYEVKGFDMEQAKEVFKTHPRNLSLNEMYLVANTYKPGSQEFTDVFETAVKMFPEDETANLNAASSALSRRDALLAEHYLAKVKTQSAEYNNAKGLLMLLKEDYDAAEKYLTEAAQNGLESAKQNLDELQKKVENETLIKEKTKTIH